LREGPGSIAATAAHFKRASRQGREIKGYAVTTKFRVLSVPQLPTLDSGAIPGFDVSA